MSSKNKSLQTSGSIFMVFGLVFTIVGATSQGTFLWIGIAFLITGLMELILSRRSTGSATTAVEEEEQPSEES